MKILLRNKETGLYYSVNGQWTREADKAHDFRHTLNAVRHTVTSHLESVEFVYSFPDPQNDFILAPHSMAEAR